MHTLGKQQRTQQHVAQLYRNTVQYYTSLYFTLFLLQLVWDLFYIYIYTSNSYKLSACHLHLPIPATVSTPSVHVKMTLPWGWFCCQALSQILAAAKCQNSTALRASLLTQWHTPPHPCFHPNLFVIPREFSVYYTVQTVAWKPRWKDAERYWINCIKITWKCWRKFLALNSHLEIMPGRQ